MDNYVNFTKYFMIGGENLEYQEPSSLELYTIPEGTILYHGSTSIQSFNPHDIKLGNDILIQYFSPNKLFASNLINGCAEYPMTAGGYIHTFKVKKPITKILVMSLFEKKSADKLDSLNIKYCIRKNNVNLDGVGWFYSRSNIDAFNKDNVQVDENVYEVEFALCDPNEFLEYIKTEQCIGQRQLSPPYNFLQTNINT